MDQPLQYVVRYETQTFTKTSRLRFRFLALGRVTKRDGTVLPWTPIRWSHSALKACRSAGAWQKVNAWANDVREVEWVLREVPV